VKVEVNEQPTYAFLVCDYKLDEKPVQFNFEASSRSPCSAACWTHTAVLHDAGRLTPSHTSTTAKETAPLMMANSGHTVAIELGRTECRGGLIVNGKVVTSSTAKATTHQLSFPAVVTFTNAGIPVLGRDVSDPVDGVTPHPHPLTPACHSRHPHP
jgi:hypothetical protein